MIVGGVTVVGRRAAAPRFADQLSYDLPGATRDGPLPAGWRHVDRTWLLPPGSFEAASRCVLSLDVLRGAGIVVEGAQRAEPGAVVVQRVPAGPVSLLAPCRIVYVLDEADRAGFAYGTLDGHPERGEEAFDVRRTGELVSLTIRSFTRPGAPLVRLGWPIAGIAVGFAVGRYGRAVQRAVG